MFDILLNCLTFLLKLHVNDMHQSFDKIGKLTEALPFSVVSIFGHFIKWAFIRRRMYFQISWFRNVAYT